MSNQIKSWPNLVGKDATEAVEQIKKETGFTDVHALPEHSPVTEDLRTNRVRVFVNDKGEVAQPPIVG